MESRVVLARWQRLLLASGAVQLSIYLCVFPPAVLSMVSIYHSTFSHNVTTHSQHVEPVPPTFLFNLSSLLHTLEGKPKKMAKNNWLHSNAFDKLKPIQLYKSGKIRPKAELLQRFVARHPCAGNKQLVSIVLLKRNAYQYSFNFLVLV